MIVVVMGVSGSGKTTVGTLLAEALGCPFLDGDSLHPAENISKMAEGIPLTDADRSPWLAAIHTRVVDRFRRGQDLVVACSALTTSARSTLAEGVAITWVWLTGPVSLIRSRLKRRTGHFVKAELLASQLDTLEPPRDAIVVDISPSPAQIVERVLRELRARDQGRAR